MIWLLHLTRSKGEKVCFATFKALFNFRSSVKCFERGTNAFYRLWVRKASPDWCIHLTPLLSSIYYLFFLSGTYPGGCSRSQKKKKYKNQRELQFYRGMNLWSLLVFVFKALGKNLFFFLLFPRNKAFLFFGGNHIGCTQSIPRMWP